MSAVREILRVSPFDAPNALKNAGVEASMQDPAVLKYLSYYQRYVSGEVRRALDARTATVSNDDEWVNGFERLPESERRKAMHNLCALMLTYGCSGGCNFCGFDAPVGVKIQLPFSRFRELVSTYKAELTHSVPFLYYPTDPLDYRSEEAGAERTYFDALELVLEQLGYIPFTSTIVPRGSEDVYDRIVQDPRFFLDRVSITDDRQSHRLLQLGVMDMPENKIVDAYEVAVGNLGRFGKNRGNENTEWQTDAGIGCFNGMLMDPRGWLYSVVQHNGVHRSIPQRQFVVPYEGRGDSLPVAGQDVRDVLARHMPLADRSFGSRGLFSIRRVSRNRPDLTCFLIEHPDGPDKAPHIVTAHDTVVTAVEDATRYNDFATLYAMERTVSPRHRIMHRPLGVAYAYTMAKYATMAVTDFPAELPVVNSMLRDFLDCKLTEDGMDGVWHLIVKYPHWLSEYVRLFRERHPDGDMRYNPVLLQAAKK
jgi:hypothetical protein